jgi:hypothetical protein
MPALHTNIGTLRISVSYLNTKFVYKHSISFIHINIVFTHYTYPSPGRELDSTFLLAALWIYTPKHNKKLRFIRVVNVLSNRNSFQHMQNFVYVSECRSVTFH